MDIMELGAIGDLVGGVAVVGSLIFVGIQLRNTTQTLRATTSYDAFKNFTELNYVVLPEPDVCQAGLRIEAGEPTEIDESTQAQLAIAWRAAFQHMAAQHYLFRHVIFDKGLWNEYIAYARQVVRTPLGEAWWALEQRRAPYPPEFVAVVNEEASG